MFSFIYLDNFVSFTLFGQLCIFLNKQTSNMYAIFIYLMLVNLLSRAWCHYQMSCNCTCNTPELWTRWTPAQHPLYWRGYAHSKPLWLNSSCEQNRQQNPTSSHQCSVRIWPTSNTEACSLQVHSDWNTHGLQQWAAVTTHWGCMSVPPQ